MTIARPGALDEDVLAPLDMSISVGSRFERRDVDRQPRLAARDVR